MASDKARSGTGRPESRGWADAQPDDDGPLVPEPGPTLDASEADALEQAEPVTLHQLRDRLDHRRDADEADAVEQSIEVPLDEDEVR
jgi:hypothetical protein